MGKDNGTELKTTPKDIVVSLIIPTYNCEAYLDETLNSVLGQLPESCELIVVDDGSSDHTAEKLRSYENKHANLRICYEKHGGASAARDRGLELAKGKYVAFMDCDDCQCEAFFERSLPLTSSDADLYIFSFLVVDHAGDPELEEIRPLDLADRVYDSASEFADEYIRDHHLLIYSGCNKFYKRSIIEENGIRFRPGLVFGEDRLFNYEYLRCCSRIETSSVHMFRYMHRSDVSASSRHYDNFFRNVMMLHRAKMECFLSLSKETTIQERRDFVGYDLAAEVEGTVERFDEYPVERDQNLPLVNEILFGPEDDTTGPYDALIVLGSTNCGYRIEKALEIGSRNEDTIYIVSGGNTHLNGDLSEAEYMAEQLREHGINENRIIMDNKAGNTEENLRNSFEFLEKQRDNLPDRCRTGIVTAGFHIVRTRILAENLNIPDFVDVSYIPAYSPNMKTDNWYIMHESREICLQEIYKRGYYMMQDASCNL